MRKGSILILLITVLLIISCGGGGSSSGGSSSRSGSGNTATDTIIKETNVGTLVDIPGLGSQTVTLQSVFDEKQVQQNTTTTISTAQNMYTFVFAKDNNGNTVGIGLSDGSNNVKVNAENTAISLILLLPIDWAKYGYSSLNDVISAIKKSTHYTSLVSEINTIMSTDPTQLLNGTPNMWLYYKNLINDLLSNPQVNVQNQSYTALAIHSQNLQTQAVYYFIIESEANDPKKLLIRNQYYLPYGISIILIYLLKICLITH